VKEEMQVKTSEFFQNRSRAAEARRDAAERCVELLEQMTDDFEELMIAYSQLSLYVGDELCSKMRMLQEFEEDEEDI
jgi:hypothetical protein